MVAVFFTLTIRNGHVWGGDFSLYIHHARNIVEGHPYAESGYIYNPFYPSLSPRVYPPVFPLLLAPVYAAYGLNLTALKLVPVICFVLSLAVLYLGLRHQLTVPYQLALLALVGFNPYLWDFKDDIRSEYPFLFFTFLALWLIHRRNRSAGPGSGRTAKDARPAAEQRHILGSGPALAYSFAIGLSIYLAFGTRTIGLVLPATLIIHDLLFNRRLLSSTAITILIFAIPAFLQTWMMPDSGYLDQLSADLGLLANNLFAYLITSFTLWRNGFSEVALFFVAIVTLTLSLVGYRQSIAQRPSVYDVYFAVYVGALLAWPTYEGPRFLIPIMPLIIFYLLVGLHHLTRQIGRRPGLLLSSLLMIALFISYIGQFSKLPFSSLDSGIAVPASTRLFEFVRNETPKDAVFIFRKPRVLSLLTGRQAAVFNQEPHTEQMLAFWQQIGADFAITKETDEAYWLSFVAANQSHLKLVYRDADFAVYRIRQSAPDDDSPSHN